jgi:Uma2 family endonuclease
LKEGACRFWILDFRLMILRFLNFGLSPALIARGLFLIQNRQVHIYRPHRELEILNAPETISGEPELPGFELVMAKIW